MKKDIFIAFLSLLFTLNTVAQTPPAKTWYENDRGVKNTVNERYSEDNSGLIHGTYIKYFPDGTREIYGNYTHGKKSGKWEFSNLNLLGGIASKSTYTYSNDAKNGEYQHVDYSDNSIEKGFYTNDLKTGLWQENHKVINGKIIYQEGNYQNGIRIGEWKNTNARPYSKDEIFNFGYLLKNRDGYFQDKNKKEYELETIQGYRTIFTNGNIQASIDPNGINVLERLLQKEALEQKQAEEAYNSKLEKEQQEDDFKKAMNKYYDKYSKKYYGNISGLEAFLTKYPNGNPSYINDAKEAIKNKPDNDAFYRIESIADYFNYEKNFSNGLHINKTKTFLNDYVLEKKNTLRDDIITDLNKGHLDDAIIGCELVLRYKEEFHESYYLTTVIYYSLALWSKNDTKAIEVIKPYVNSVIHFSNMNTKFKNEFWNTYKTYKKILDLESKQDIYKAIKAL